MRMLPGWMEPWRRTYWTVWVANLVTSAGLMSFVPFFPAHLARMGLERGAIELWAGLLFGAAPLTAALTGPLWGALGDRLGRKVMSVRALLAITLFVGLMSFARTPGELLFLRLCQGVFSGFVAPSITLVSVLAPAGQQGRITGSLQTALAGGAIVGPILGGELGARAGLGLVFLMVAGMALVSATLVGVLAYEDPATRSAREGSFSVRRLFQGTARDVVRVLSVARMRAALGVSFAVHLGQGATRPLLYLLVADLIAREGVEAERWTGRLTAGFALANLVAMPLWGRLGDRYGHAAMLVRAALLGGATFLLHALAPHLAVLFALHVLHGAALAGSGPLVFGIAAGDTPIERRGGAVGVVVSSRTLAIAIGAWMAGILAHLVGLRGLFAASGVVLALSGLALWRRR